MRHTNEIADCVRRSLDRYFKDLDGAKPRAIYDMVLKNVERPMLELVLDRAEGKSIHRRTDARDQPQYPAKENPVAQNKDVNGDSHPDGAGQRIR